MGHHLDWPRRLGMALDAAKVSGRQLRDWLLVSTTALVAITIMSGVS